MANRTCVKCGFVFTNRTPKAKHVEHYMTCVVPENDRRLAVINYLRRNGKQVKMQRR